MEDISARIADNIQAQSAYGSQPHRFPSTGQHHLEGLDGLDSDTVSISTDVVNPERAVKQRRPRPALPPVPDLRFHQSYLASIGRANTWQEVAWITLRDQMILPLVQGTLWSLALSGWRHWTKGAQASGRATGLTLRQLWLRFTNWKVSEL